MLYATVALVLLAIALLVLIIYLIALKRDIRSMTAQLGYMQRTPTNATLTTSSFDRELSSLALAANELLERHKADALHYRQADATLRQELTNISHDLRTPLTSASGYLQLMESAETSEAKRAEYAAIVQAKLAALSALLDQLFEFTQTIEGNKLQLDRVNVSNSARDVLAAFYDDFVQSGFDVRIEIPEAPLFAVADADALRRVFSNLTQNALKHGTGSFEVDLEGTEDAERLDERGGVRVTFRNTVENVGLLDIAHIFDRFYTSDASRTQRSTGLGLAIAKSLVEDMGGTVEASIEGDRLSIAVELAGA
jgi:signal transduction histidine kinase